MSEAEVICSRRGAAGDILLNRPKALNALTLGMVSEITRALESWRADPAVERIVVRGAGGRAFCAGGDIRLLHDQGRAGDHAAQLAFWGEEYVLNHLIQTYPKPYVAVIDGIVMGGGVGISVHGSHRIVGEQTMFAMPEVGIGFFPDVGASYFLPRLPGRIGTWLALTGARIGAGDVLAAGLATSFVPSAGLDALAAALAEPGDTDAIIARFVAPAPAGTIDHDLLDRAFAGDDLNEILARLDRMGADGHAAATELAATIRTKSPTSLAIALRQIRLGATSAMADCMVMEFRIVSRIARGHDFYEGVRALLIDKDNHPHWSPADIAAVTPALIDPYFASLGADDLVIPAHR
jgi:enoyl-CoA hydratase